MMDIIKAQHACAQAAGVVKKKYNGSGLFVGGGFIAGGFVRDVLLGVKPKDIDVALSMGDKGQWDVPWEAALDTTGEYNQHQLSWRADCAPIDFLIRSSPATACNIIEYHTCGLANAFYSLSNGLLIIDETFVEDVRDQVIRRSRKCTREQSGEAVERYLRKVHAKYPHFRLELPT